MKKNFRFDFVMTLVILILNDKLEYLLLEPPVVSRSGFSFPNKSQDGGSR